jgi:hypothetical protein
MTQDEFRALALELPGAIEDSHMGHPDFRIGGRIFATLGPKPDHGMVKLPIDTQQQCVGNIRPRSSRSTHGAPRVRRASS